VDDPLAVQGGGKSLAISSACQWGEGSETPDVQGVHDERWWPAAAVPGMTGRGQMPALPQLAAAKPYPGGRGCGWLGTGNPWVPDNPTLVAAFSPCCTRP
jgi:hypothetical protein